MKKYKAINLYLLQRTLLYKVCIQAEMDDVSECEDVKGTCALVKIQSSHKKISTQVHIRVKIYSDINKK